MKTMKKEYVLKDFMEAVAVINQVAKVAEEMDHHPDIHLTGYKKLTFELTTHSAGKVTQKDFDLAAKIDSVIMGRTEASAKSTSKR